MAPVKLRSLIKKRKKALSIINMFIGAASTPIGIKDVTGQLLLGDEPESPAGTYPVELEGQTLGWVVGGEQAVYVASLLTYLAGRELEKKTLANEVLDNYRELNLLYNLSEKMAATVELSTVAQLVIDEAGRLITATDGAVMVYHDQPDTLVTIAAFGQAFQPKLTVWANKGIIGDVTRSGRAEIVNDVSSDSRSINGDAKTGSLICAPLKSKQQVIGVILIGNREPVTFTAADLKLINTIASQAAPAIENALLFQKERQAAKKREKKLKQQIVALRIELDEARQKRQVAEITETDYFRRLEAKAQNLRAIMEGNEND